jgi:hypothetical protein
MRALALKPKSSFLRMQSASFWSAWVFEQALRVLLELLDFA